MTTPNLSLRELTQNQTAPDVAHNEALQVLDTLVQCVVVDRRDTEPASPVSGDIYILGDSPSGTNWTGKTTDDIAYYYVDQWYYITPTIGWLVYNTGLSKHWKYTSSGWTEITAASSSTVFSDDVFRIQDNTDNTKQLGFEVSNITTSTTRTITVPDSDVELFKDNLSATTAPTANDDNTVGYSIGSRWIDVTNDAVYTAVDVSTGAAIWRNLSASSSGVTTNGSVVDNELTRFDTNSGTSIQGSNIFITDNAELYGNYVLILEKTAAYTVQGVDSGKVLVVNSASAVTITLPQTTTESINAGWQIAVLNRGAGTVTIAVEGSDTLESKNSNTDIAQYSSASIIKYVAGSPNTWGLFGDLS